MTLLRKNHFFAEGSPFAVIRTTNSTRYFNLGKRFQREFFKLTWIQAGKGNIILNDQKFFIQEHSIFLVHPKTPTTFDIKGKELELVNILFDQSLLKDEAEELARQDAFFKILCQDSWNEPSAPYIQLGNELCEPLIRQLENEQKCMERHVERAVKYTLLNLLIIMSREAATMLPGQNDNELVTRANHLIAHDFRNPLTVGEIARKLGITPNYLCTLYKQKTGNTILAVIRRKKLEYAEEKLRTTMLTAAEIADLCGFNDLSHFYRLFHRKYGVTPRQYRRQFMP